MENFITVKDSSMILEVTPDTVRERIYRKEITARKISRGGRNIWMIDPTLLRQTRPRRNTKADVDALLSGLLNEQKRSSYESSSRDKSDLFEILEMLLQSTLVKEIRAKPGRVLELVAQVLARLSELIAAGMELFPVQPDPDAAKPLVRKRSNLYPPTLTPHTSRSRLMSAPHASFWISLILLPQCIILDQVE